MHSRHLIARARSKTREPSWSRSVSRERKHLILDETSVIEGDGRKTFVYTWIFPGGRQHAGDKPHERLVEVEPAYQITTWKIDIQQRFHLSGIRHDVREQWAKMAMVI